MTCEVDPECPPPNVHLGGMARQLLPENWWERVRSLLPVHPPPSRKGGRPWADDRSALRGIVFVLRTGLPWADVPAEVFGVSGVTCWRRLRDWMEAGVWDKVHPLLLEELGAQGRIDWSRAAIDSTSVPAKKGVH